MSYDAQNGYWIGKPYKLTIQDETGMDVEEWGASVNNPSKEIVVGERIKITNSKGLTNFAKITQVMYQGDSNFGGTFALLRTQRESRAGGGQQQQMQYQQTPRPPQQQAQGQNVSRPRPAAPAGGGASYNVKLSVDEQVTSLLKQILERLQSIEEHLAVSTFPTDIPDIPPGAEPYQEDTGPQY